MSSSDDLTNPELQDRIESLESRVSELETLVDENHSLDEQTPVDRYDDPVLAEVRKNGDPGAREMVELFQELTPITDHQRAVKRTNELRNSRRFKQVVEQ